MNWWSTGCGDEGSEIKPDGGDGNGAAGEEKKDDGMLVVDELHIEEEEADATSDNGLIICFRNDI